MVPSAMVHKVFVTRDPFICKINTVDPLSIKTTVPEFTPWVSVQISWEQIVNA